VRTFSRNPERGLIEMNGAARHNGNLVQQKSADQNFFKLA
jgi:hypothetical protein